ncbi:hypothetical protein, partial [Burkholderia sp. HI2714]|uniref:hypothetical protein n=1 Tax=Burkholderia sp. HI2714 TaxID=2015359 RepID=UPI001C529F3E
MEINNRQISFVFSGASHEATLTINDLVGHAKFRRLLRAARSASSSRVESRTSTPPPIEMASARVRQLV